MWRRCTREDSALTGLAEHCAEDRGEEECREAFNPSERVETEIK